MTAPDPTAVLACPLGRNDAGASTVREYFAKLLTTLWEEGEGFSGKRPFGNSGWKHELYQSLIAAGLVDGALDSDGYVERFDEAAAATALDAALEAFVAGGPAPAERPIAKWLVTVTVKNDGGDLDYEAAAWNYDAAAGLSLVTVDRGLQVFVPIRALMMVTAEPVYEEPS